MPSPRFQDHRDHFDAILNAVQLAARPEPAIRRVLQIQSGSLQVGKTCLPVEPDACIYVIAIGKAAIRMAPVGQEILGDRLTGGLVTLLPGTTLEISPSIRTFQCGHPLPDTGTIAAGEYAARMLTNTKSGDILLALISGGGSAMFELPAPGVSLQDLQDLNRILLASGIAIQDVNTVRRAISRVKAGGLARLAAPAKSISIILSDVIGNQLSKIASGPTVLRSASSAKARQILEEHDLWPQVPTSVRNALETASAKKRSAPRPVNVIAASNHEVVESAQASAEALGYHTEVVTRQMKGEARWVGGRIARRMLRKDIDRPTCFLWGGETTVQVTGRGRGGRNQELALSAALAFSGSDRLALMSYATDGIDGPTDAAGAIVTGETIATIRELSMHPESHLEENDSYPPLAKVDALIRTGPTGTNLNDLVVGLAYTQD